MKCTVDEIRKRFDKDVERFSSLDTGQVSMVDAPLLLNLVAQTAAAVNPKATHLLDIGCGAGNYTLKLLRLLPHLNVTLVDLSQPMLDRAIERIQPVTRGTVRAERGDIRELYFEENSFDMIVAEILHKNSCFAAFGGIT